MATTAPKAIIKVTLIAPGKMDEAIAKFHKSGQTLQKQAHVLACSALAHLEKSKDIRQTLKFLDAMPKMARLNGLKMWFEKFGPIAFNADGTAVFVKNKATELDKAIQNPFWDFNAKEGVDYEPIDMAKFAVMTIKKLKTDAEKTGRNWDTLIAVLEAQKPVANLTGAGSAGQDPLSL